jgi:replication factor A1
MINHKDTVRVRYGVSKLEPLDYLEEARYLRDLLKTPWAQ